MKKIFSIFLLCIFLGTLCSCSKHKKLEKEGYVFIEAEGWYEKEGESRNETVINLTQSNENLQKTYAINSNIEKIVFIGNPQVVYSDFNIIVNSRSNNLYIEFQNFNYKAETGKIGLDASNVIGDQKVYLLIKGTSSIIGGKGSNGKAGISHNYNSYVEHETAEHGGSGKSGDFGLEAIFANNLYISINENSKLTLTGGAGGDGGRGGDGQGSKNDGIGQAGHGGDGGNGGLGGAAIKVTKSLSIDNKGECKFLGGNGGKAGNGGRGGENKDTGALERADHGGNGGNGGNGGIGGTAIYALSSGIEIKLAGELVIVQSGNGGNGGNGGQGGSSCKNELQSSNGGEPGDAGSGGNGGNAGEQFINCNFQSLKNISFGGKGGSAGKPGYNSAIGYGDSGEPGTNGIDKVN